MNAKVCPRLAAPSLKLGQHSDTTHSPLASHLPPLRGALDAAWLFVLQDHNWLGLSGVLMGGILYCFALYIFVMMNVLSSPPSFLSTTPCPLWDHCNTGQL